MKKIIGLVVILAAIVLGGYYGMGIVTEHSLKKNLNLVNQSNGVLVDIVDYQRGLFRSTAKLNWKLHIPAQLITQNGQSTAVAARDYHIEMPLTIFHGPIIFADSNVLFGLGYANTNVLIPAEYEKQFNDQYTKDSVLPTLNLSVFVSYLNKTHIHVSVPPFKLISKQGINQFEWLGMNSDVSLSSGLNRINGRLVIDGINMVKEDTKAVFGKIESDYDIHRTQLGLYLGSANLLFPSALVTQKNTKLLEMEAFNVHSTSEIKNGLFSSSLKAALNELFVQNKLYGPCLISLAIKNIDAKVLAEINNKVNKAQREPASARQQILLSLLPDVPKLVGKGAEFEMSELNLSMPGGFIKGNLLISLPNETVSNPFQLIQRIQGHGQFEVSAAVLKGALKDAFKQKIQASLKLQQALAETAVPGPEVVATTTSSTDSVAPKVDVDMQAANQAEEKISALVKAGVLLIHGTDYVLGFKLSGSKLLINDKPFDPAMVQF